jgi:tetratricopeptide (TPR) repeat protein
VLHKVLGECSKIKSREEAFTILGEALEVYLCSKLKIGRSSFSRNTGVAQLDKIVGKEDADKWDGLLKTCEMARFAPGLLPDIDDSLSLALDLTKKGEKKMKSSNLLGLGIILISMVMAPSLAIGNDKDVDKLFQQANDAYVDGQYELAAALYEEVAQNHLCFELEYNMGNAHYKLSHIGESILHYERARLINPLDGDLRANLLLAELRAIDRIEALPGVGIDRLVSVIFAGNLYWVWLILSLVTWTTAFVFIAISLKWGVSLSKPFLRGGAVVSAALSLVFLLFLYSTNKRISESSCAIVMDSRVEVRSMPGELGMSLFQLHEGTRACIVSKENEWTQVKLDNGNVGWLLTSAIEPI